MFTFDVGFCLFSLLEFLMFLGSYYEFLKCGFIACFVVFCGLLFGFLGMMPWYYGLGVMFTLFVW